MATGCASVPPVQHPTLEITLPEEWTTENSRTGAVEVTWWEDFDDGGLSSARRLGGVGGGWGEFNAQRFGDMTSDQDASVDFKSEPT